MARRKAQDAEGGETRIKFCGAARTVTGSCVLVRACNVTFLVDCGLFQGHKTIKELNYRPFPFDATSINFVLLTHAHIDHAGLLPRLWKEGFRGAVYMTRGSRDLLSFMLPDSGHIQEMEVEALNRRNLRRGRPEVVPIYTGADAEACQGEFRSVEYEEWVNPAANVRARFWNAGHILGSASIEVEIGRAGASQGMRLLFSGDIGPSDKLFHADPEAPAGFDYVVCEATYGGRVRTPATAGERRALLAELVKDAIGPDSILLLPLFAVERTQELIADLTRLQREGRIPQVPMFLDSPLAIRITKVFSAHARDLEELDAQPSLIDHANLRFSETRDESKAIDRIGGGAIILAASGMCEAGRIRHHLKRRLWSDKTTVLLAGYQAPGTLGRLLVDGVKVVTIQGEDVRVNATIKQTDLYSGHADGKELADWIAARAPIRQALFLTHGEDEAISALQATLQQSIAPRLAVVAPALDEEFALASDGIGLRRRDAKRRLPDQAESWRADWHNDLAQFQLDVRERLEKLADEKSRAVLMRRLRRALEER